MSNWYDKILKEFIPGIAPLTLTADPDGLLLEENLLHRIREKGFELITYADPVEFRFEYESKYRECWDRGESLNLMVVFHGPANDLDSLPYDLLQNGRKLSFSLGDLFPKLSCPVVAALDRRYLDTLYKAQQFYDPGEPGEEGTKEFILRHVFEVAPELIKEPKDLLRILLRIHYRGERIPVVINQRFVGIVTQNPMLANWPLERIIPNREDFFAFLQERWSLFLDHLSTEKTADAPVSNNKQKVKLEFPGPAILPFDHDDIRIYMDNLFNEGFLKSVPHKQTNISGYTWAKAGIYINPAEENKRRLSGLLESIKEALPGKDARYHLWRRFAFRWAEINALIFAPPDPLPKTRNSVFEELRDEVDKTFTAWLLDHYSGLMNLPTLQPVMSHHIPGFLAHQLTETGQKAALILIDGLSLDQWIILRDCLLTQLPKILFQEDSLFAWIPTISSVSRQAVFSGKVPYYFPTSIHTTNRESELWQRFWLDRGLKKDEVLYKKGLALENKEELDEALSHPKIRAAGLIINKVDKIMHGMELGSAGMHNQVNQWVRQGFLASLIESLFKHGFSMYLTSDHGNIEARGCGQPAEGAVADLRSQRTRIYTSSLTREKIKEAFPGAMEWPSTGLPEDYLPLLAPGRLAFVKKKQQLVCHGGLAIEEVIVPLIKISRR